VKERFSEADRRFMARPCAWRNAGEERPGPIPWWALSGQGGQGARARLSPQARACPTRKSKPSPSWACARQGATLYVTLEPCCHRGRTGPCTDHLALRHSPRGRRLLRRESAGQRAGSRLCAGPGLRVDAGCLKDECRRQNRAFFSWIRNKRPWVTLKVAATLDGCIGDRQEKHARQRALDHGQRRPRSAHELRAKHDAVLVGVGPSSPTTRASRFACPAWPQARGKGPLRIVLDSHLRTPPTAALLREGEGQGAAHRRQGPSPRKSIAGCCPRQRKLEAAGAEVWFAPASRDGRVDCCPRCCAVGAA
jgi:diaminohydroxyphosphoribosylaminopyrimidine deaminase/5-amino-6-(5-phosphoribosylamino)uracil reductase